MLAYELARLLTCHACNFIVTAKIHNDEQGEEYEITSVNMERTSNEAYGIVLEMVPIALPKGR